MKKKLLTLMFALVAIAAAAQTFTSGDFTFSLNSDGTASLTGVSTAGASKTSLTAPGYVYYTAGQKRVQVTTIKEDAFINKTSLTEVRVNYGVTTIEGYAFYGCSNLKTVSLPSSLKSMGSIVFYNCPITLVNWSGSTVPSVQSNTFSEMKTVSGARHMFVASDNAVTAAKANSNFSGLFTVVKNEPTAYDLVVTMGTGSDATLSDVYCIVTEPSPDPNSASVTGVGKCKINYATFRASNTSGTLKINKSQAEQDNISYDITEIANKAFYKHSTLKVLDMSQTSKVERIRDNAFYGCTALTTATVRANIIHDHAFDGCTNLATITLSEGVKQLGYACFAKTAVSTVNIPASLTSYGAAAFGWCPNLTKFTVASSSTAFATDAMPNCLYNKEKTILYQMGGGADESNAVALSNMPNTLTTIYSHAMAGARLYTVDIPYGVKEIGGRVFDGMPNVKEIRIPSSVTSINTYAFYGLTTSTFKNLYINLKTIPMSLMNLGAFDSFNGGVTLHVPKWRTNHYKDDLWWSSWKTKISSVVEDAYDFSFSTEFVDLYYTVSSTASYTDAKVQSAAVNGQLTIVRQSILASASDGIVRIPNTFTHRGKTYIPTEIQRDVFSGATEVKGVTGGKGIKKIGAKAFYGTTGCTNFGIPYPVEIGDSALFNCKATDISLGDRLTTIGDEALHGSGIKQALMPNTVTKIGARFLADTKSLDTVRVSTGLTEIPAWAFAGVRARYIVLPYGVKKIGACAFYSDKGPNYGEIDSWNIVVIPGSVTEIDPNVFYGGRHLDQIYLNCPYGVLKTEKSNWLRRPADLMADNPYNWSGHKLYVPTGQVKQYQADPGIKACWKSSDITAGAFDFTEDNDFENALYRMTVINPTAKTAKYVYTQGTPNFNRIAAVNIRKDHNSDISYTMVEIGDSAWVYRPAWIKSVTFSKVSTIKRIGNHAFYGCVGLENEVSLPESVTEIGSYAFDGCTKLPSVFVSNTGTTSVKYNAVTGDTRLYVPLNQLYYHNVNSKWATQTYAKRQILPYYKATSTGWNLLSVPVNSSIVMPTNGEFYYSPGFVRSTQKLKLTKIDNKDAFPNGGYYGGMLLKGTEGEIYRFRDSLMTGNVVPQIIETAKSGAYNRLEGVGANSPNASYTSSTSGRYYYKFDGKNKFDYVSSITVPSGDAFLWLYPHPSADNATAYKTVYIDDDITYYDLTINGESVTSSNCDDLTQIDGVSGTVKYDPDTKTLLLKNAKIETTASGTTNANITNMGIDGLTIKVEGNCTLKITGNWTTTFYCSMYLRDGGATTITGTGSLACQSSGYGCVMDKLTIEGGVQMDVAAKYLVLTSFANGSSRTNSRLTMNGANTKLSLQSTDTSEAAVYCVYNQSLNDGLAITQPAGARFSGGAIVYANGSSVKTEKIVISKPTGGVRGDVDGDGTVGVSDVNILINIMLGKSGFATAADVDGDGTVGVSDVNILINIMLGKS